MISFDITEMRATRLLTDDSGAVVCVMASQGDEELKISAKCVIIATGSISSNKALLARFYLDVDFTNISIEASAPHNTGDGLLMAEEIGAASTHISTPLVGPIAHSVGACTAGLLPRPKMIKVNRNGERYTDEAMSLNSDWGLMCCMATDRQPGRRRVQHFLPQQI